MYFTEAYEPRLSDYNAAGNLSIEAILQILENAGTRHTMMVYDKVADSGVAWVLVDWRVEIGRRPKQFQKLHIKTWVHGRAPASTAYRDFIVMDDKERELLRAQAKFALVDIKAKRMTRISAELFGSYGPENDTAFDSDAPRLQEPEAFDTTQPVLLRRSDIDYNGHVHNTRYVDFALDALPEDDFKADGFTRLHVVYRSAVQPSSEVEIKRAATDGGYAFCLYADGKLCTMIELQIQK